MLLIKYLPKCPYFQKPPLPWKSPGYTPGFTLISEVTGIWEWMTCTTLVSKPSCICIKVWMSCIALWWWMKCTKSVVKLANQVRFLCFTIATFRMDTTYEISDSQKLKQQSQEHTSAFDSCIQRTFFMLITDLRYM